MRKSSLCISLFLFLFVYGTELFSQENPVAFNKPYFKSYITDTKDIILAPFHWNSIQIGSCAGIILGAGILSLEDVKITDYFQRKRTNLTNNFSTYGVEPWGNGEYSMATMALFYLGGTIFKDDRSKKVAMLGLKTYILTGGAVEVPKFVFQRARPYQNGDNQYHFAGPKIPVKYTSLPSGHTTSAYALATIVASEYKEKPLVGVAAYTIATMAGIARIHDYQHWASDVVLGAAFGYAMGKLIYNRNNWGVKQFKAL